MKKEKHMWEVIVGNLGIIYRGTNGFRALYEYNSYVSLSKRYYGRAANESCTLIRDGEIHREYAAN